LSTDHATKTSKKKTGEQFESIDEVRKKATRQPTRAVTAEESWSGSREWETKVQEEYMKRYNLGKEKAKASEFIRACSKQRTTDNQSLWRSAGTSQMKEWASPLAMQRLLDSLETKSSIAKHLEEERRGDELEEVEDLPEDECWGLSDDNNNIDKKTEEGMITSGGAKKEEGTTSCLEGSKMEGEITTWEGRTAEEKKTTGTGSKTEEVTTITTLTNQTSIGPLQRKDRSLGKRAKATYPRSCTESVLGQVDSQGSQKVAS
jgi:hypothetical protein